jgi:hypothetical protein
MLGMLVSEQPIDVMSAVIHSLLGQICEQVPSMPQPIWNFNACVILSHLCNHHGSLSSVRGEVFHESKQSSVSHSTLEQQVSPLFLWHGEVAMHEVLEHRDLFEFVHTCKAIVSHHAEAARHEPEKQAHVVHANIPLSLGLVKSTNIVLIWLVRLVP